LVYCLKNDKIIGIQTEFNVIEAKLNYETVNDQTRGSTIITVFFQKQNETKIILKNVKRNDIQRN
jgi:hypothetical protein